MAENFCRFQYHGYSIFYVFHSKRQSPYVTMVLSVFMVDFIVSRLARLLSDSRRQSRLSLYDNVQNVVFIVRIIGSKYSILVQLTDDVTVT